MQRSYGILTVSALALLLSACSPMSFTSTESGAQKLSGTEALIDGDAPDVPLDDGGAPQPDPDAPQVSTREPADDGPGDIVFKPATGNGGGTNLANTDYIVKFLDKDGNPVPFTYRTIESKDPKLKASSVTSTGDSLIANVQSTHWGYFDQPPQIIISFEDATRVAKISCELVMAESSMAKRCLDTFSQYLPNENHKPKYSLGLRPLPGRETCDDEDAALQPDGRYKFWCAPDELSVEWRTIQY